MPGVFDAATSGDGANGAVSEVVAATQDANAAVSDAVTAAEGVNVVVSEVAIVADAVKPDSASPQKSTAYIYKCDGGCGMGAPDRIKVYVYRGVRKKSEAGFIFYMQFACLMQPLLKHRAWFIRKAKTELNRLQQALTIYCQSFYYTP